MMAEDVERIARLALRELGTGDAPVTVSATSQADRWQVSVGGSEPVVLKIRAGSGTTPQHIREQIVHQFVNR
jgi:hypothetical protein